MVRYLFKLKKSYIPDLTHITENDYAYGGVILIYSISLVNSFKLFKRDIVYHRKKLGVKMFLNPFKKCWNKRKYRLAHTYWGKVKHPLTRLWVTLSNDTLVGNNKVIPEVSLVHTNFKLFGHMFNSKQIAAHLFKKSSRFFIVK